MGNPENQQKNTGNSIEPQDEQDDLITEPPEPDQQAATKSEILKESQNRQKAKTNNIFSLVFLSILVISIIIVFIINANGLFNYGAADILMILILPVQFLFGVIALLFKIKAKDALMPPVKLTAVEKRNKRIRREATK